MEAQKEVTDGFILVETNYKVRPTGQPPCTAENKQLESLSEALFLMMSLGKLCSAFTTLMENAA